MILGSTALTAYTAGSATDLWGRTWTMADFGNSFRLRVIDATSQPNKQLRLDAIQVAGRVAADLHLHARDALLDPA